ncbi:hypothetical protein K2173_011135 [Erythroxylum novogranatense]|uniref:Uncharacterized protein n=1 Tax=Erythroxylum novogranatense TaxID=1862640 RepID=A0AAV8UDD3_9ROSI|nr:hypothetical protein K2173_011135 [Erythroxylum novogranatense]
MVADGAKKSQTSSIPPRKINVQKFAESRAPELEALHSIVSRRLNNDFRSRRNKRRRTNSFESQAARKRHRKKQRTTDQCNAQAFETNPEKLPRRIRRRFELRKNPASGFCTSGDGTKRLRTHVWHAKRFTMTKSWGYHLPLGLHGRGRGSRALLKWFREGVLVHDASYCIAVQLEGPEDSLLSVLRMVLVPPPLAESLDANTSVLSGATYANSMLHHVGAPTSQSIAPVFYLWRPPHIHNRGTDGDECNFEACNEAQSCESCLTCGQVWVWIHVSAFDEGYDALKLACQKQLNETGATARCFSLDGQLAKFEVMGSKAFQLLQKTLHPISCSADNSLQLNHESHMKKFAVLEDEESISSCSVLSLTVKDPRMLPVKSIANMSSSPTCLINDLPQDEAKEHASFLEVPGNYKELLSLPSSIPDANEGLVDNMCLWDVSCRLRPPVEENILCLEKHHARMDFIFLDDPKATVSKNSIGLQSLKCCPILLLKNNIGKGRSMGWSIILPISWARVFWISFISKGAHAIGLREKRWVACEVGLPYFPSDFPDCSAYSSFKATEEAAVNQKAERMPPAVRPFKIPIQPHGIAFMLPLAKIWFTKIHYPIQIVMVVTRNLSAVKATHSMEWWQGHQLQAHEGENKIEDTSNKVTLDHKLCLLRVFLHAYKEGVFEEGAVVCAPCISDVSLWNSRSVDSDGGLQISHSSVRSYFKHQQSGNWELQLPEDAADKQSHRWPIGFVTTGFVRGSKKPVAQAFCEATLLARLREEQWKEMPTEHRRKEIYVLVRNLRSSAYRLAHATIILEQQSEDVEFL